MPSTTMFGVALHPSRQSDLLVRERAAGSVLAGGICYGLCARWLSLFIPNRSAHPSERMAFLEIGVQQAKTIQRKYDKKIYNDVDQLGPEFDQSNQIMFRYSSSDIWSHLSIIGDVDNFIHHSNVFSIITFYTNYGCHVVVCYCGRTTPSERDDTINLYDPNLGEFAGIRRFQIFFGSLLTHYEQLGHIFTGVRVANVAPNAGFRASF